MSSAILDAAATNSKSGDGTGSLQLVSFRVAEEDYGIEINKVREIILMGSITRIPQSPDYVKGVINLRSTVIPVIDLRMRFGLPAKETTDESRILVVTVDEQTIGVIVDAVDEVLRISQDQISPPPPTVESLGRNYLTGLAKLDDRLLILLDIDKFLGQEAKEALAAVATS